MKLLLVILSLLVISSCSPTRRLNRLLRHHPELITKDTLTISDTTYIPRISKDTTFFWKSTIDTFLMDTGRLHIKIYRDHDTLKVHGDCDSIYVYKTIQVPYDKVVVKQTFWLKYGQFLIIFLFLVVGWILIRKLGK